MIREEIKLIKESPADLRKFGYTVGAVFLIIAAVLFYLEKSLALYFIAAGLLLIIPAAVHAPVLKPVNKAWMTLAVMLGWVMTRVILFILFFFVVTPISFLARIAGKEFIKFKYDKEAPSYWENRERKPFDKSGYERQF